MSDTKLFAQGLAFQAAGQFRAAEERYQAILGHNPHHADANNAMGTLAIEAGKPDFAIGFFEKALKERPQDFRFLNNLGNVFVNLGRTEEGLPYLQKALKQRPSTYELLCNIGRAYQKLGVAAQGLPLLRRAVALRPEDPNGLLAIAEVLISLGQYEEGEEYYRALARHKNLRATALHGLATSRKQTAENNVGAEIERELMKPDLSAKAKAALHYAAAKVNMDLRRPDDAWVHLEVANGLTEARYDVDKHVRIIGAMTALFNASFMSSRRAYGSSSQRPVFVVGMPRSGTSLTEQILSSHPNVVGAGELTFMHTLANKLFYSLGALELFSDQVRALSAVGAQALAQEYLDKISFFSADSLRITDKMPHNFMLLGLIGLLFPRAKVIYCRRDPLDNCFSIFANMLNDTHSYGSELATLGWYYRQHVELMRHWQSVMPDQILEVEYERLVEDLEGVSRGMIDFIGLPWDPACLDFYSNDRAVSTISKWQVRQPIYKTSVARWKPYEKYLGPLKEGLGDLITTEEQASA